MDPRVYLYGVLAVALAGAGYGLCHLQSVASESKLVTSHTQALSKIRDERDKATKDVRDTEKRLNDNANDTRKLHEKQLAAREFIITGLRDTESNVRIVNNELRRELRAYAARKPTVDPSCPSDPRPAILGNLLEEAISISERMAAVARESTESAERHADEVRTLKHYAEVVCRGSNRAGPNSP